MIFLPFQNLNHQEDKEEATNGPFPVEWVELAWDEVETHRVLGCKHYNNCLAKAAHERWVSWTCLWCEKEKEIEKDVKKAMYDV